MADASAKQDGTQRGPRWAIALVVVIAVLACCVLAVAGGGAAWLLWGQAGLAAPWRATATSRPVRGTVTVPPATPVAQPTPTQLPPETVRPTATATLVMQPTPTWTPTQNVQLTATPTAFASPTPTPVVCNGIDALDGVRLAPGQAFRCTVTEDELNAALAAQPDLPCRPASLALSEGSMRLTCRIGILNLGVNLALEAADCRAAVRVVGGAPRLTELVEDQIAQYMELVPYDQVCVERAEVTEDAVTVEGYRY